MVGRSSLDLQRAVMNTEALFKRPRDVIHEGIARVAIGHHQMNCQGALGGTHAPDVQVMDLGDTGPAGHRGRESGMAQGLLDRLELDPARVAAVAQALREPVTERPLALVEPRLAEHVHLNSLVAVKLRPVSLRIARGEVVGIAGLLGVMDGAQSDLRTGLPWQMVEIHEPTRLAIVDAASGRRPGEGGRIPDRRRDAR